MPGAGLGRALWASRANLDHAWRILRRGACDGCGLSSDGWRDWALPGAHRCPARLARLQLHTQPALDLARLRDVEPLLQRTPRELAELGRVSAPLLRRAGERGFRRVTWGEALDLAAERIQAADPQRVALLADPRGSTLEDRFVAQALVRLLGSPHVASPGSLRQPAGDAAGLTPQRAASDAAGLTPQRAASDAASFTPQRALGEVLGHEAPTVPSAGWLEADLLLVAGEHVGLRHPAAARVVEHAQAGGSRVLRLGEAPYRPTPGGELAFLRGVAKTLLAKDGVDRAFLAAHTEGLEELTAGLDAEDLDALVSTAGVTRSAVFEFAAELCRGKTAVFLCSGQGPEVLQALCTLGLLRGFFAHTGSGLVLLDYPGALGNADLGYAAGLEGGLELEVLWALGGDPQQDDPVLAEVPLRIHTLATLDRAALVEPADAALLLPLRTRYEQRGGASVVTADGRLIRSPWIPGRPPGEARSAWELGVALAQRLGVDGLALRDAQAIRAALAEAVPVYRDLARLRPGGACLRSGPPLFADGRFPTRDGRARLRLLG